MRGQRETGWCGDLELDLDIFSNNCSSNQVLIKTPNGSFLKHRLILQPIVETVILLVYSLIET